MTLKTTFAAAIGLAVLASGAAQADHGNPWATADDTVLSKNHDSNQARSIGTPGEDEMRGVLTRNAFGKQDNPQGGGSKDAGGGKGSGAGADGGKGSGGHGGGGKGDGGHGGGGGGKGGKH